ncbi:unnamed protein product [Nezara viridula]|uniref:Uncharacterized protein n=1 Tax=Nezara viridula TaxID=85310 RepID=A0A9P0MLU3_NEZVI|nr:unnamed protein product [Nezara viridula]
MSVLPQTTGFALVLFIVGGSSFNLDTQLYTKYRGDPGSMFGFSVSMHREAGFYLAFKDLTSLLKFGISIDKEGSDDDSHADVETLVIAWQVPFLDRSGVVSSGVVTGKWGVPYGTLPHIFLLIGLTTRDSGPPHWEWGGLAQDPWYLGPQVRLEKLGEGTCRCAGGA